VENLKYRSGERFLEMLSKEVGASLEIYLFYEKGEMV